MQNWKVEDYCPLCHSEMKEIYPSFQRVGFNMKSFCNGRIKTHAWLSKKYLINSIMERSWQKHCWLLATVSMLCRRICRYWLVRFEHGSPANKHNCWNELRLGKCSIASQYSLSYNAEYWVGNAEIIRYQPMLHPKRNIINVATRNRFEHYKNGDKGSFWTL